LPLPPFGFWWIGRRGRKERCVHVFHSLVYVCSW
jgi:hypothetical protein